MHSPRQAPIGVPDSFPMCDPSLMHNTMVKMLLLDFGRGADCMNEYAGFLMTVLCSICSSIIESDRSKGKYIRYTPEDLERMLGEFFEGKTRIDQRR